MKKIFKTFLAAAVILSFVACDDYIVQYDWKKHQKVEEEETDPEGDPVGKTFSASLSAGSFAADDAIMIYWGKSLVAKTDAKVKSAGSSTSVDAQVVECDNYYAVYPASIPSAYVGSSTLSYEIPSIQDGSAADIEVAYSNGTDMNFKFAPAVSFLKFTVTRDDIAMITIKGTNSEKLAGTFKAAWADGAYEFSADASVSSILFPTEAPASEVAPGEYTLAIAPGANLPDGFTLTCRDVKNRIIVAPFVSEAKEVQAGKSVDLGIIDQTGGDFITEYFVTPSGAGEKSGKNWANALDPASLRTLFATPSKVGGYSFYFAGGTYDISDAQAKCFRCNYEEAGEPVAVQFYGGFNPASAGKSVDDRDISQYETVFSGDRKNSGFNFGMNTDFLFDGITFADFISDDSLLSEIKGAIGISANSAKVTINDCVIRDNEETATDTGKQGGSGLFVAKGKCYVTNTLFTGNQGGSRGGAIRNDGSGLLFMYNCTMTGNVITKDSYGMAMFARANTALHGCTIINNNALVASKNNPSVNLNYNVIVTNTVIIDDSFFSTGTGVIRVEIDASNGYAGVIMNSIVFNTHPEDANNVAWAMLPNKLGLYSGGHNIFGGKDGALGKANFTLSKSDKDVKSLEEVGVTYVWHPDVYTIEWQGGFKDFSFASDAEVKSEIRNLAPTADISTIGADFADWLVSIGAME